MELLWRNQYLIGVYVESGRIWKKVKPIRKGEVVLVEDEFHKRQTWLLAVVKDVYLWGDRKARMERARTATGHLHHPTGKLYPSAVVKV